MGQKFTNGGKDLFKREIDCLVINSYIKLQKENGNEYDSVRGVFFEGNELYPTAGFREKAHIQIAIINPNCIKAYKVKHITVNPGERLSIHHHLHRSEHWGVVSGTATVTVGTQTKILTENESTYIPLGTEHSIANEGKIPLVVIEIQTGDYLEEDDIVRIRDFYGRE